MTLPTSRPDRGATYWRTLAEAYGAPAGAGEFPVGADLPPPGWKRRDLLQLCAAGMALAGLGGCAGPGDQALVPYVREAERTPGAAAAYATAMTLDGYATGLVVEAHEGRPTKIEGNPQHPASRGACGVLEQAELLALYDPDRAGTLRAGATPRTWDDLRAEVRPGDDDRGEGLAVLLEPESSPLLASCLERLRARLPLCRVFAHAPLAGGAAAAAQSVLGGRLVARHDLAPARVIVALDSDLLASGPWHLAHAADFATHRRAGGPAAGVNRLYVAESSPTCTGGRADHRLRIADQQVVAVAAALLARARGAGAGGAGLPDLAWGESALPEDARRWVRAAADDLARHRGAGLVVAGPRQPPLAHALAHALNEVLGNAGRTVAYGDDPLLAADGDLAALAGMLAAGAVRTLVSLGGDPLATAPADLGLAAAWARAGRRVHLGLYENATARASDWFVPAAHWLESWGDARALDGTVSLQQPLIRPLRGGRTAAELVIALSGGEGDAHGLLRAHWQAHWGVADGVGAADPSSRFALTLHSGVLADSATPARAVPCDWNALGRLIAAAPRVPAEPAGWELSLRADAKVHDGRFANNPWLLELPDPVTKLTWGNAALVSPRAARRLGVVTGDVVALGLGGRTLEAPVLVQPGQADGTVTLALGYGRARTAASAPRRASASTRTACARPRPRGPPPGWRSPGPGGASGSPSPSSIGRWTGATASSAS